MCVAVGLYVMLLEKGVILIYILDLEHLIFFSLIVEQKIFCRKPTNYIASDECISNLKAWIELTSERAYLCIVSIQD